MSSEKTSFSGIDRVLADIKNWGKELKELPDDHVTLTVKFQMQNNVIPFFDSMVRAIGAELSEQADIQGQLADTVGELIDQEDSFLQPELAGDLAATLSVGMAIVGIIESEGVVFQDDLKNRKLQEAIKIYKTNTTLLLEEIEAISKQEEEEDEDASIIHGESEGSGELDRGTEERSEPVRDNGGGSNNPDTGTNPDTSPKES